MTAAEVTCKLLSSSLPNTYYTLSNICGITNYSPDISKLSPFRKLNEQANAKLEAAWPALHERKEKQRGEAQKLEAERQMQTTAIPETVRDTVRAGGSPSWEAMHYMRMHPDDLAWLKAELGEELWEEFVAMINGRAKFWDRKVEK